MRVGLRLGLGLPRGVERLLQLAQLVFEIGERACRVRVLEVDRGRATLHLPREEQRGERLGNVVEDPGAALLLALDLLPPLTDPTCRSRFRIAEDVRMTSDELCVHGSRHLLKARPAALGKQEREEVDLEQQVTELVGELRVVPVDRRVGNLVRLLEGMRNNRPRRLLAIPGTFATETLGQALQLLERRAETHVLGVDEVMLRHGSGFGANPGSYFT